MDSDSRWGIALVFVGSALLGLVVWNDDPTEPETDTHTEEQARYLEDPSDPSLEIPKRPRSQDRVGARIASSFDPGVREKEKAPPSAGESLLRASAESEDPPEAWQPSESAFLSHTGPFFEGVSGMTPEQAAFYLPDSEKGLVQGRNLRTPSEEETHRLWNMPETPARFAEYLTATWATGAYLRRRGSTPAGAAPLAPWEELFLSGLRERAEAAWLAIFQADPEWELAAKIGIRAEQE